MVVNLPVYPNFFLYVLHIRYKDVILFEKHDQVCTVTLNRPDNMNALNEAVLYKFDAILDKIAKDDDIRVVVLAEPIVLGEAVGVVDNVRP